MHIKLLAQYLEHGKHSTITATTIIKDSKIKKEKGPILKHLSIHYKHLNMNSNVMLFLKYINKNKKRPLIERM